MFLFCYKIHNLRSLETPSDMRYYDLLHMDWKHLIFFFIYVFNQYFTYKHNAQ